MGEPCFICAKHRGEVPLPGGLLYENDLVVLSHLPLETPTGQVDRAYLGHLFVEPRRHVAELGDLDAAEAAQVGQLAARASRALTSSLGAEHVYAAVIGHHVAHLHLHLWPRYPGTPTEYRFDRLAEWPDAPMGDTEAVEATCALLRGSLTQSN